MANEYVANPLGLPLDVSDVGRIPPSMVVWGAPGAGKTFEVVRAFSVQGKRALVVQSNPTILKAFQHYVAMVPGSGLTMPDRVTLDETTVATHFGGSTMAALVSVISRFIAGAQQPGFPYDALVFDEHNVFCERVFSELKASTDRRFFSKNGNQNIFAVQDAFKTFHRAQLSIARRTRKAVAFVCHYQLPKIDEDPTSPMLGQIKWPGGPKMPLGLSDQIVELCADADVVVQIAVEDPPKVALSLDNPQPAAATEPGARRKILTTLEPRWFRKIRGFNVPMEEPLDIEKGRGLRELLLRCGYVL